MSQGSKLTFQCTCKVLLVRIFSTSKLVRPLANSFPLFGRHGWFYLANFCYWRFFFTRRLSKSLAFCEFASVNFEPCEHQIVNSIKTYQKWVISRNWTSTTVQTKRASFVFTLKTEKQYESMLQNLSSFRLFRSADRQAINSLYNNYFHFYLC